MGTMYRSKAAADARQVACLSSIQLLHSGPRSLHLIRACQSFNVVTALPEKGAGNGKARHRGDEVELHDGPQPEAAQRRRLLHGGQVAVRVGNVDEVAAGHDAHGEEDGLAERALVAERQARDDDRVRGVRVEEVEEEEEDWRCFKVSGGHLIGELVEGETAYQAKLSRRGRRRRARRWSCRTGAGRERQR